MIPGVQSFVLCCGTVRYAISEEMLLLSETVRRFLGNLALGCNELSVKR